MWCIRAVTVLLLQGLALVIAAGPASAHSELVSSSPADGATLDRTPTEIELVFGSPLQDQFVQVVVEGPDGGDWAQSPVDVVDGTVTIALRPLEQPGVYDVAYRIVSTDGHPITDGLSFTVAESATGLAAVAGFTATETVSGADHPTARAESIAADQGARSGGAQAWAVGIPAAVLAALIAAVAVRRRLGASDEHRPAAVNDRAPRVT